MFFLPSDTPLSSSGCVNNGMKGYGKSSDCARNYSV